MVLIVKQATETTPDYSKGISNVTNAERGTYSARYKSSTSSATTYSQAGGAMIFYANTDAIANFSNTAASTVMMKSNTKMSVFIAGNSYGFMSNVDYRYIILYSS